MRPPASRAASITVAMGATVVGNTEIGAGSRIGAGSVVLPPIPPGSTAVGVPARMVGEHGSVRPTDEMDQLTGFGPDAYHI